MTGRAAGLAFVLFLSECALSASSGADVRAAFGVISRPAGRSWCMSSSRSATTTTRASSRYRKRSATDRTPCETCTGAPATASTRTSSDMGAGPSSGVKLNPAPGIRPPRPLEDAAARRQRDRRASRRGRLGRQGDPQSDRALPGDGGGTRCGERAHWKERAGAPGRRRRRAGRVRGTRRAHGLLRSGAFRSPDGRATAERDRPRVREQGVFRSSSRARARIRSS